MPPALDREALAHLRHELRTPLNHLIGYSEMMLEEVSPADSDALHDGLRQVLDCARKLLALVNDLSRAESTQFDLRQLARNLSEPLQTVTHVLQTLKQSAIGTSSHTLTDLERMEAAARNLRAAIDSGLLTPVTHTESRTPSSTTIATSGVILVVDDDEGNRDLLGRRLEREGHAVQLADNGREALVHLRTLRVNLVLLDVRMPELDGYQVLQEIKADEALRDIPVLMISAVDDIDSVVRCIELGAEDYLPKPFNPILLRARIGACLEKKHLRDQEAHHLRQLADWNVQLEKRVADQVSLLDRLGRLKRFFSPQLAELIVAGGAEDPLKTHRREVTVCFLDLRGFTAFAESAEPEEVMGVLREYHAQMGKLILQHEGTLERFTGDGMMIFFNDPVPVPDAASRAVSMALEMRECLVTLVEKWRNQGYDLGLGIGIAQGFATIGAIGFEGRWDYGAIGSVTNLAARLCSEAKAGEILVAKKVLVAAGDTLDIEPAGELTLKGFQRPIPAYNILRKK